MFQNIDLNLNAGPIKNAWMRLIRQIQTEVEHKRITNDTVANMAKGDIVYMMDGDRQAALADASAEASANWAAVVAEPIVAGERGIARTDGYALVRFEDDLGDLSASEGQAVWLSEDVPGAATVAAPQGIGSYVVVVGILADAQLYTALNPFAWVVLGHCCLPATQR
jgi:hypothetical protein